MYGAFSHTYGTINGVVEVNWNWHVAPIVKLRDNELYILDPLMGSKPLKKDDYHLMLSVGIINAQGTGGTQGTITGYVTCRPDTYDNNDDCFNPHRATSLQTFERETKLLLDM